MALRLAPVQITAVGYPGTTGLSSVDYYMHSAKPEVWKNISDQFIEKGLYFDSSGSFTLKSNLPQLKSKPILLNKFLTIGVYINTRKYNKSSWEFWTTVGQTFNDIRFVFLGVSENSIKDQILKKMKEAGVSEKSIILKSKLNYEDYLEAHNEIDLLLDSCIYTGGTSAISAMLMGTPLISVTRNTLSGYSNFILSEMYGIAGNCCHTVDEALIIINKLKNNRKIFIDMPSKIRENLISRLKKGGNQKNLMINNLFKSLIEDKYSI
jgi:hypothetical protein